MAISDSTRYGYISRESAAYLGMAPATLGGGVINTNNGYLAALPSAAMHHHIREEVDAATWERALEHAEWLQEECGI